MKKYEFTGETMEFEGHTLRRIHYVRDVGHATPKGTLGGWIESEENLSHEGSCYVAKHAKVFGYARVKDDARLTLNAEVKDNAQILGDSCILDDVIIGADTIVTGQSYIAKKSNLFFYATDNYGQPNVTSCHLFACNIEATGTIRNSVISHESLYGHLEIKP